MEKLKAVNYGKVELIPGIICDGYVLDNGTAVMSLRGIARLLDMDHAALVRVVTNGFPKTLKPFIDKGLSVVTNSVKVVANNSPHKGRYIVVCTTETIETFISAYALALAKRKLRQNQLHIGERCIVLLKALVRTILETSIQQACGLTPNIQQTVQEQCIILM
ncbi:MAG: hypothetical protein KAH84_11345, partial [Thiomargarita sp.]|nr:hypothetical protein [Bacteroidales bacterium]MCK5720522.1 hypothetical protein [Thiomargarita sp.]